MNNTKSMPKQTLYSKASVYTSEVIDRMIDLIKSTNQNVALGAFKVLLNKSTPDLKALAVFENDMDIPINAVCFPGKKWKSHPIVNDPTREIGGESPVFNYPI